MRNYLDAPGVYVISNNYRFDSTEFTNTPIKKESRVYWAAFDTATPTLT